MGAKLNRGTSRQDWQTPLEFLQAVYNRLKISRFKHDLAASKDNPVALSWYDEQKDSLVQPWSSWGSDWLWLNPPYSNIAPWAKKACLESIGGAHIAMLVPASVGANWWKDWVDQHAYILFLNGRITFVGATTPYPKDLALLLYTPFIRSGNAIWTWKDYV